MTVDEYKKANTLHVELPSGLCFDAKAPSGLLVARWQARIVSINPETEWNDAMTAMLQEFEHCLPEGLKVEDLTPGDYAALIGIASPFFETNPFPSQFGSVKPSEPVTESLDFGPTNT